MFQTGAKLYWASLSIWTNWSHGALFPGVVSQLGWHRLCSCLVFTGAASNRMSYWMVGAVLTWLFCALTASQLATSWFIIFRVDNVSRYKTPAVYVVFQAWSLPSIPRWSFACFWLTRHLACGVLCRCCSLLTLSIADACVFGKSFRCLAVWRYGCSHILPPVPMPRSR